MLLTLYGVILNIWRFILLLLLRHTPFILDVYVVVSFYALKTNVWGWTIVFDTRMPLRSSQTPVTRF